MKSFFGAIWGCAALLLFSCGPQEKEHKAEDDAELSFDETTCHPLSYFNQRHHGPISEEFKHIPILNAHDPSHHVVRLRSEDITCSGVLINRNIVLTAAHCAYPDKLKSISFYRNDEQYPLSKRYVKDVCIHPSYYIKQDSSAQERSDSNNIQETNPLFDIAWVRFANPLPKEKAPKISILRDINYLEEGLGLFIYGYGIRHRIGNFSYGNSSDSNTPIRKLMYGRVHTPPVKSIEKFNRLYGRRSFNRFLLVSKEENHSESPCKGDSGGPVFVKHEGHWLLVALTQGNHSLLTPFCDDTPGRANCQNDLTLFTLVGNYWTWLKNTVPEKYQSH